MKLTCEQRLERTHVQLMQDPDFCLFSGIFMLGEVKVSDEVPTAYTNGRDVTYGRAFVESLNDKQLAFVVLHEAMHKAYRHLFVWRKLADEDMRLANMAMDYVINLQLMDYNKHSVLEFPTDAEGNPIGLLDEQYRGMDTKQVFDLLKQEIEKRPRPKEGDPCDDGQPTDGKGKSGQKEKGSECLDDHGWKEAKELSNKEKEELNREINQALREGAMIAGRKKGNVSREIQDLMTPKVDWKQVLREFVKSTMMGRDKSTFRRPNRRFLAQGIIMPSTYSDKVGKMVVGTDTSGSIYGETLTQFLSEIKSIADEVTPDSLDLLYWDTEVAKHETYEGHNMSNIIQSTKPEGGGGTSPECVPKYLKEQAMKPQCVIMLTDGYFYNGDQGDWREVNAPVMWCVIGNKQFNPAVGKVVHISN